MDNLPKESVNPCKNAEIEVMNFIKTNNVKIGWDDREELMRTYWNIIV